MKIYKAKDNLGCFGIRFTKNCYIDVYRACVSKRSFGIFFSCWGRSGRITIIFPIEYHKCNF